MIVPLVAVVTADKSVLVPTLTFTNGLKHLTLCKTTVFNLFAAQHYYTIFPHGEI
jgi:hypothetical protein